MVKVIGEPSTAPAVAPNDDPKPTGKAPRPLVPPRAPATSKRQTKVLLSVTDGKIEWDKMAPENRKQFETLFSDPEFLKQFGLLPKDGGTFDPDQVKLLFDSVSMVYASVCRFLMKWPPEALRLLAYTSAQKEMLKQPTANLLNKLAPAILMKNQELLVFATVFFSATQENFLRAKQVAVELKQKELADKRATAAASPHATVSPAPSRGPDPIPMIPSAPKIVVPTVGVPPVSESAGVSFSALR